MNIRENHDQQVGLAQIENCQMYIAFLPFNSMSVIEKCSSMTFDAGPIFSTKNRIQWGEEVSKITLGQAKYLSFQIIDVWRTVEEGAHTICQIYPSASSVEVSS